MQKKLSVSLLNDSFPPTIDGVANAVFNYATELDRAGHEVTVATPSLPGAVDRYPFSVVRYPSINIKKVAHCRTGLPLSISATREITSAAPDILHTHCPFVSGVYSRALRRMTGAPVVLTYHTKFDIDIANVVESTIARAAAVKFMVENIEACDEVWTVSDGAGINLKSLGFRGNYRVMENGVDFPLGQVPDNRVRALNAEYGLSGDMPVFMFVGRMMWYKGIRIILDGLAKAKARGASFKMVFIGGGEQFDEIKGYTAMLGLAGDCVFTGAMRDREKLRDFFSRADTFLFPSTYDTNGIVVREAAACSLPSVLVRGSCAAEGVTDGRNGILIDENSDSLSEAVLDICYDRDFARRVGHNASETLYLSWEDAVDRAQRRYSEILYERLSMEDLAVN